MIDLKTKQEFWAEQLPAFKEKYWIPDHLEVLEFDMNGGCFDIAEGVKTDLSEEDLFDIYHRVNSGWAMWKKAVSFMREKAEAQAVPETHMLVEQKNTEDWYLDEDEGLWLDHDGIDGTLCDLAIGEIKPVEHKEYLITKCRTLYAARVWDQEDDHIAWQFFESEEEAKKASDECKKMYEANESGASL
ncbi:hypothetical protein [Acinetobacter nosocomialis]|uniref:hypothetical protein n=1 Tax=Acinetobacter nosocomialis TaxID=106654 RepID=UPI0024DE0CDF|nr:hypothetical protein [Acinetobacter nosocomialis]